MPTIGGSETLRLCGGHSRLRPNGQKEHRWFRPPFAARPQTQFTPPGFSQPVNVRTGWREGESHREIWGPTWLWVKRETDGWSVPASEDFIKRYGNPNTDGTSDWAIFSNHIDSR